MSENTCESNSCGTCGVEGCDSRHEGPQSFLELTHEMNAIRRVIGVVSGKGGVGKSLVTSSLAVMMRRKGYEVGVMDADITGPSIPKVFGVKDKAYGSEAGIFPQKTHNDIGIMSVNLLLEDEEAPVIWRGPVIANMVKQFWTDVIWGEVDYLFLDMPPGTGDVPLTVFQSIPLDGIIIVTSPQDLVSMIVTKAYNMAKTMNIPVLGIVENMSFVRCPDCGKEIKLFGESKIDAVAEKLGLKVLARLPIDPAVAALCDSGEVEKVQMKEMDAAVEYIEKLLPINLTQQDDTILAIATEGDSVSGHFGKCEQFTIVEFEGIEIKSQRVVSAEGHGHGLLPGFLASMGVNMVIAGGMGDGMKNSLRAIGIEIVTGVRGTIESVLEALLNGELEGDEEDDHHGHDHSGGCGCGHHH